MNLTISYKSEGEYTESGFDTLDDALDRAEILAESGNMVSRYNRDGTFTFYRGKVPTFFGYVD